MAGRPRLPAKQKILLRTFHKYRNPKEEAEFDGLGKIPPAPKNLNKHGKSLWQRLIVDLNKSGVITQPDLTAFEMLCAHYARAKELEEFVSKDLLKNIENDHGAVSAQVRQMNAEFEACEKLMGKFGLTPSDRNKFGVGKKKEADPDTEKMKELLGA